MYRHYLCLFIVIVCYLSSFHLELSLSLAVGHSNVIQEVNYGKTAILHCPSTDKDHNFMFWQFGNEEKIVIGPGNQYDKHKYEYEILTGKLIIREVNIEEDGIFNCVSKGVRTDDIKIQAVRMIVKKDWEKIYEDDPSINALRVFIVIGMLIIIIGGGFLIYKNWKNKHEMLLFTGVDNEDDDESTEEVFSKPGTSYRRSSSRSVSPFCTTASPAKIEITKSQDDKPIDLFDPFGDNVSLTAFNTDFKFS